MGESFPTAPLIVHRLSGEHDSDRPQEGKTQSLTTSCFQVFSNSRLVTDAPQSRLGTGRHSPLAGTSRFRRKTRWAQMKDEASGTRGEFAPSSKGVGPKHRRELLTYK